MSCQEPTAGGDVTWRAVWDFPIPRAREATHAGVLNLISDNDIGARIGPAKTDRQDSLASTRWIEVSLTAVPCSFKPLSFE
jgi:hypothetical protein